MANYDNAITDLKTLRNTLINNERAAMETNDWAAAGTLGETIKDLEKTIYRLLILDGSWEAKSYEPAVDGHRIEKWQPIYQGKSRSKITGYVRVHYSDRGYMTVPA